jgi:hypothetical protein
MTQYKSIKITTEDYEALKRYMHLGFQDSMTEAFHSAIQTALFEEYGEGLPRPSRSQAIISDLTTRAQVNAEERDQALQLLHMTVPDLHAQVNQVRGKKKEKSTSTHPHCEPKRARSK